MKTTQTIHTLVELAIEGFPSFVDTDNIEKVITKKCNISWQLEFTEDDGELTLTPVIIEQPKIKVWYIEDQDEKTFEIDLSKLEKHEIVFYCFGGGLHRPNPSPINDFTLKPKTLYVDMKEGIFWIDY